MTTNHIERLDPALIRPGRVDMKLELYLANEDMINQLFYFVYNPPSKTNIRDDKSETALPQPREKGAVEDCELLHLGQEFVAKVPTLEFSPSVPTGFSWLNLHSPYPLNSRTDFSRLT